VGANSFGNWKHMEMIERYKSIHAKRKDGLKLKKKRGEDEVAAQVLEKAINWLLYFSKSHACNFVPSIPKCSRGQCVPSVLGEASQRTKKRSCPKLLASLLSDTVVTAPNQRANFWTKFIFKVNVFLLFLHLVFFPGDWGIATNFLYLKKKKVLLVGLDSCLVFRCKFRQQS
jgi:hypothetical protein